MTRSATAAITVTACFMKIRRMLSAHYPFTKIKFSCANAQYSPALVSGLFLLDLWKMEKPALKVPCAKLRRKPGPPSGFMTTVCIPCSICRRLIRYTSSFVPSWRLRSSRRAQSRSKSAYSLNRRSPGARLRFPSSGPRLNIFWKTGREAVSPCGCLTSSMGQTAVFLPI